VNADGAPQSSTVWIDRDDDAVVVSALAGWQKVKTLLRDPRVSVTVCALDNPYRSAEIRGLAEVEPDPDNSLGNRLSQKYLGRHAPEDPSGSKRVNLRITPQRINEFTAFS
jgi:PPOX class probable F420-dependent enzyme